MLANKTNTESKSEYYVADRKQQRIPENNEKFIIESKREQRLDKNSVLRSNSIKNSNFEEIHDEIKNSIRNEEYNISLDLTNEMKAKVVVETPSSTTIATSSSESEQHFVKKQETLVVEEEEEDIKTAVTTRISNNSRPKTKLLSKSSFQVDIYIPLSSLKNVMDSIANIDLLRVWFRPIYSVRKDSSSGSSVCSTSSYDDFSVEVPATLRIPSGYKLFHCYSSFKSNLLGYAPRGTLTVEKQQLNNLILSISPFAGASSVEYHFHLHQEEDRGVLVTTTVHMNLTCCILCVPSVTSHVQQVIESMEEMRMLVEFGETAVDSVSLNDSGVTPLLGGPII